MVQQIAELTDYSSSGNIPMVGFTQSHVIHSDGTIVALYRDPTNAGDFTRIRLMRSVDDGVTWASVGTITAPVTIGYLAVAMGPSDQIGVLIATETQLRFCQVTWGTWAASAWETLETLIVQPHIARIDLDYTSNGEVGVAVMDGATNVAATVVLYRKAAGGWTSATVQTEYSGQTRIGALEAISISNQYTNNSNKDVFIVASGCGSVAGDQGVKMRSVRIDRTSGLADNVVLHWTQGSGGSGVSGPGIFRALRTFKQDINRVSVMHFFYDAAATRYKSQAYYGSVTSTQIWSDFGTSENVLSSIFNGKLYGCGLTSDGQRNHIFHYTVNDGNTNWSVRADVHYWSDNNQNRKYATNMFYVPMAANRSYVTVGHGVRRNYSLGNKHGLLEVHNDTSTSEVYVNYLDEKVPNKADGTTAIIQLTPVDGATQQLGQPNLYAKALTGYAYESQGLYRVEFQFSILSDFSGGSPNTRSYLMPKNNNLKYLQSGIPTEWTAVPNFILSKTVWYYRARIVDIYGNVGAWTPTQTFAVGHPPSATLVSPKGNGFYEWNAGVRTFIWDFFDLSPGDTQSAYQLVLRKNSDNSVITDTGKVSSSAESYTNGVALDGALKDQSLNWTVRLWDTEDSPGAYAPVENFTLTDPPAVTVQTPTVAQEFDTGVPTFLFTPTTGGGRGVKSYTVVVTQGASIVWTKTVTLTTPSASGVQLSLKMDQGFLENNSGYSVQIQAVDTGNLTGFSPLVSFTTAWIPPASPTGVTVDISHYNTEEEGYVLLEWDDAARDVNFTGWTIARKADMIDTNSGVVLEEGVWEDIYTDYAIHEDGYQYRDYLAPSTYQVTYSVVQWVNRIGQDIPSLPTESDSVEPTSDGYWLIEPSIDQTGAEAFKLSIVTSDEFTDEQEENEFVVIGRGRVVNKGQRLGNKGTLGVQLRHTGGTTARQKRLRLKDMQQRTRQLYLRNPFGDIFRVSVSSMSIGRLAGVGTSEFCDVTIPYSEVS